MLPADSQTFLRELDKKLWTAAGRLRSDLDTPFYKHIVLGLIFLKYVSDSFAQRQAEIETTLRDPDSEGLPAATSYETVAADCIRQADRSSNPPITSTADKNAIRSGREKRDQDIEKKVLCMPAPARWKTVQDSANLPPGTEILKECGRLAHSYKITSTGTLIDDALEAVEKQNPYGAERHRRHSNVARRVRAGARIKIWTAADRLRSNLDAAVYKQVVRGLIFPNFMK